MANLKLFLNNPSIKNIKQFIDYYKLRVVEKKDKSGNGYTVDEFFEYNKESIFNQLGTSELQELAKNKGKKIESLTSDDIDKNITLPCPSYLFIDEKYVDYSLIAKHSNFQAQETDVIAFEDKSIRDIIDGSYVGFKYAANVKRANPGCRVIGYFKSLYFSGKKNEGTGNGMENIYDTSSNFIDLSKFVISLNTTINSSGGNFSISFPHIPVYSKFIMDEMTLKDIYKNGINSNDFINKEQYNDFQVGKNGEHLAIRSEINSLDYFEWLIQPNDLLFISFDDMTDLTKDNCIAGSIFDMIALVDSVSVSRNATGSVSVDVSGRDLMKLLTDDSSIYFPSGVSNGNKSIFDNTETVLKGGDLDSVIRFRGAENQDGTPRQITGLLDIFASEPNDFSIDFVLKTVVSHLANMQIVPDDLFINWGDKRTKFSMLKPKKQ